MYKKTSYWGAEPEYSLSEKVYADSDLKYPLVIKYYVGMDSDQAPSHRIVYTYDSEMRETSVKYYFEEVLDSENRNYIYSDKRLTYDYVEYEGEIEKPQLVDITYADDYYKYPVRVSQLDYDTKEENQYDAYEYDAQWRVVKRTTGGKYFEEGDRDYVKIVEENYAYKNKVCTFDDNYYDADGMIVSTRKKVIYYY